MAQQSNEPVARETLLKEIAALILLIGSIFAFFSLISFSNSDPSFNNNLDPAKISNYGGLIGAHLSELMLQVFGVPAYLLPIGGVLVSFRLFLLKMERLPIYRYMGYGLLLISIDALAAAKTARVVFLDEHINEAGGLIGRVIFELLATYLNTGGTIGFLLLFLLVGIIMALRISLVDLLGVWGERLIQLGNAIVRLLGKMVPKRKPKPALETGVEAETSTELVTTEPLPVTTTLPTEAAAETIPANRAPEIEPPVEVNESDLHYADFVITEPDVDPVPKARVINPENSEMIDIATETETAEVIEEESETVTAPVFDDLPEEPIPATPKKSIPIEKPKKTQKAKGKPGPEPEEELVFNIPPADSPTPPLSLLDHDGAPPQEIDQERLAENARMLEEKLRDFKVIGEVVAVKAGPVVTMYEFLPAPGVKVNKIVGLTDDLTMAMSALSIRIVAPIPGRGVVGIEIPNDKRDTVYLKEILEAKQFQKSKSKLPMALGKDIFGQTVVSDLAKMPHLLVAGSTGSGKSVSINTTILSLLYTATPEDVRIIMVDPKMLELSIYEGIPHLLLPVVTDPKKASLALNWAVREMERRYKLMADKGVRNIDGYNAKIKREEANRKDAPPVEVVETPLELDPEAVVTTSFIDEEELDHGHLPYIVVIVDELADLMMVAGREIEESIARLAQMARAAGIHLILATQRPSVDVITGLIKANFPTRISFKVFSRTDSRTILDCMGAETLLGMGDMLFLPPGTGYLQRVHGAFVSEDEVQKVVDYLKQLGEPEYDESILTVPESSEDGGSDGDDEYDARWDEALQIVADSQQASISMLQRRLKVGYNRAARMIEQMEREGIVGPSDGTSRPREVFIGNIEG